MHEKEYQKADMLLRYLETMESESHGYFLYEVFSLLAIVVILIGSNRLMSILYYYILKR